MEIQNEKKFALNPYFIYVAASTTNFTWHNMVMDTSQFLVIWTNKKRDTKFSRETHRSNAKWLHLHHMSMHDVLLLQLHSTPCDFVIFHSRLKAIYALLDNENWSMGNNIKQTPITANTIRLRLAADVN